MQSSATTPSQYMQELPADRKAAMKQLRTAINENIPDGFREEMTYGMLGWVVPHSIYAPGYHVTPAQPLPFICLASQKNFIALYHSGLYADAAILEWFKKEFASRSKQKLDMGKSCVRFKKPAEIPVELIGELSSKITVKQFIDLYEKQLPEAKRSSQAKK
ncbi:MAG: DUF1801 domain-containing protein [Chitinophagaceae bacterium]|nr:MAG: DUF1801 domain-containing protein [Chitinophagaceae bacterium]